jgi:hypothetical protein
MRIGPVFLTFGQHRGPPSGRDLLGYNPWVMHEDKVGYWSLFDENLPCGFGRYGHPIRDGLRRLRSSVVT